MLKLTCPIGMTWLQAALVAGEKYCLDTDVEESYNKYIAEGYTEEDAAFGACMDWDILEFVND